MKLVILESPYAGDVEANLAYARRAVRDSLGRGEAPIASHLLYTQPGILNDAIPYERQWGIDAGLAWKAVAQGTVAYVDHGISKGMQFGIKEMLLEGKEVRVRLIVPEPRDYLLTCGPDQWVEFVDNWRTGGMAETIRSIKCTTS